MKTTRNTNPETTMDWFLFEAQTGIIHLVQPKAPSNYYRFKLPWKELAYVRVQVDKAKPGTGGMVYDGGFLDWLSTHEMPY